MRFTTNWGFIALSIYLILVGLTLLLGSLSIPPIVTGVLALAAGILILIGR